MSGRFRHRVNAGRPKKTAPADQADAAWKRFGRIVFNPPSGQAGTEARPADPGRQLLEAGGEVGRERGIPPEG